MCPPFCGDKRIERKSVGGKVMAVTDIRYNPAAHPVD
jgi:hypothetical protein